jgi:hypothetical protein
MELPQEAFLLNDEHAKVETNRHHMKTFRLPKETNHLYLPALSANRLLAIRQNRDLQRHLLLSPNQAAHIRHRIYCRFGFAQVQFRSSYLDESIINTLGRFTLVKDCFKFLFFNQILNDFLYPFSTHFIK